MTDKFLTPEFRATFISVLRPSAGKNQDGTPGTLKYSIRAAFPPTADLTVMQNQAKAAAFEKWGDKVPKTIRSPFRTNEELDNPVPGIGDDWTIVTFSCNADKAKPGLVDAQVNDIIDESEVYSGAWFRVQTRAFAYDKAGNKGVAFDLQNVQKLKDDDAIGGGRTPANKAFEPVGGGAPKKDIFG